MTSREDPFPLVCIENALLRNNVICFNKGVGSAEFVSKKVDYLDRDEMVESIYYYRGNPARSKEDAEEQYNRVAEFTLGIQAVKVYQLINGFERNVVLQ